MKNPIRSFALAGVALSALCILAPAADSVEPALVTITNARTDAESQIPGAAYKGVTVRFTNCVALAAGGARQGLDSVEIDVAVGTEETNVHFAGAAQDATAGTWACTFTMPTNWPTPSIQVKLTDAATNVYIYPRKSIALKTAL